MKPGRPSKYKPEYIFKVREYVDSCQDTRDLETYKIVDVNVPTMTGLCLYLSVNKDTLYEWGKKDSVFKYELDILKQKQFVRLIQGGLSGDYNLKITSFILKLNHGMNQYKGMDKYERLARKLFNSFSKTS